MQICRLQNTTGYISVSQSICWSFGFKLRRQKKSTKTCGVHCTWFISWFERNKGWFFFLAKVSIHTKLYMPVRLRTWDTCRISILQEMFNIWVLPVALHLSGQQVHFCNTVSRKKYKNAVKTAKESYFPNKWHQHTVVKRNKVFCFFLNWDNTAGKMRHFVGCLRFIIMLTFSLYSLQSL